MRLRCILFRSIEWQKRGMLVRDSGKCAGKRS